MLNMRLSDIEQYTGGHLSGADSIIHSVVIDSRDVVDSSLFVAIKGERVNGHDFLAQALESGAAGALVEKYYEECKLPQVQVKNSVRALADIARQYRIDFCGQVIGITGSSGKTSTKEMLINILSVGSKVSATQGNRNNEIGVPLTLLAIDKGYDYAVVEMGAAQKGDIAYLMDIVQPDISVITNVHSAHIGRFGSEEIIAETKAEIYAHLKLSGKAVINLDEKYSESWKSLISDREIYTYSLDNKNADVYASDIVASAVSNMFTINYMNASVAVNMRVAGIHNISNALCAASCALAAGVSLEDVASGLEAFVSVTSRLQKLDGVWEGILIDDTYNANPASVKAAIDVLSRYPGRRFLVLGDMAELGNKSPELHSEVGVYARNKSIDRFVSYGEDSKATSDAFGAGARHFEEKQALSNYLLSELEPDDVVLVKGSRSAGMEEVVSLLKKKVVQ